MVRFKNILPIIFKLKYSFLFLLFVSLPQKKIEAKPIKYSCAIKKQAFFWKTENWRKDTPVSNWDLKVDLNKEIVFVNKNEFIKLGNFPSITRQYLILKSDKNFIVAVDIGNPAPSSKPEGESLSTSTLILDLKTKNLTHTTQIRNYLAPYSFYVYFGQCYKNNY
tara:strand:+ start:237 stop:731 length:495 start_codon:yes stop_codon:yes gene_type:complete